MRVPSTVFHFHLESIVLNQIHCCLYKMHLAAAFLSSVFITGTLATTAAVVNFANNTGAPEHLASGTLYGLPENGNQIPVS